MSRRAPVRWYTTTAAASDTLVAGGCGHLHPSAAEAVACAAAAGGLPVAVDHAGRAILPADGALLAAVIAAAFRDESGAPAPPAQRMGAARARVVAAMRDRIDAGEPRAVVVRATAAAINRSASSVHRWLAAAAAAEQSGRAAAEALTDKPRSGRPPQAWSTPEAEKLWRLWRRMRNRLENPASAGCHRRVEELAATRGWTVPSCKTFQRRWLAEDTLQRVRDTEGRIAALEMLPHQVRTVEGMRPLDWVNGDGYEHHLFVVPPDGGDPIRPHTWAWQDVRTRRILAWRSGLVENEELLRLSFHDLVTQHGIPRHALMDRTRAASAKSFGGDAPRGRREENPASILKSLGVIPHRTTVDATDGGRNRGRGRSKPVERAFLDWGEEIDKDPLAAGAYTGRNVLDKPENYGGRALEWDLFLAIVANNIARMNARTGRRTEAAAGRSFDAAWEEEIAGAPVRRLPAERTAILFLAMESTKVRKSGVFTLQAGSAPHLPRNQYYHPDLVQAAGERVVARFDPGELHQGAHVFRHTGEWLCFAECRLPVAFDSATGAKEYARLHRTRLRLLDKGRQVQESLADLLDAYGIAPKPAAARSAAKVVEMVPGDRKRPDNARRRALEERRDRGLQLLVNE